MDPTDNNPDDALDNKLEELEELLEKSEAEAPARKIQVPVLDDLVTEEDFNEAETGDEDDTELVEEQIEDLAQKLEHKFSGELDQLVRLLKDNLKSSIVEELRVQANLDDKHDKKDIDSES
ncbi:MAG: hypothetical protein GKR93_01875 [Gammaproteobacteria bacterium]|nr:hypothetical protein [Gammaproteobacteria bacterium]